ncbi:unnamed protein product [Didymodactylos carnosus]|uniref:3CxxC-type domain-containing protein n=1 Tax=Didymodactylos carnosus TaxID=1234261 RepID=A0A814J2Z5_9BILA|nr:unnamed protein product [Didymodactylos carnosus]CAF3802005.1 unnamed protein product [Didymodactylos carnosus]
MGTCPVCPLPGFNHPYNTWRIQELPLNETVPTDGWSRINVRPVDYVSYKLPYKCSHCSNSWSSNRHAYMLFKFNRQRRQIKMRVYRQQCLECHSQDFVKPSCNELQLREAINYVIDRMTNGHVIIGNDNGGRGRKHTEAEVNQACEACHFDICKNPIID